ncbi:NADPH-Fe(3+) oxidoreductase subunit beta [bioreactor metagenome]|uniref:NADPH-Fe(3+) oxidoreductase subunit beta n=1 Tax=bioreactor metagenome TaxID=1076179 RepID=A0A644ZKW7_9ZZZZ
MALIANGRFLDAYDLIRQENPMPSVCGRICTHPCESKCRRGSVDEALAICDLKRFVADYAFKNQNERMEKPSAPKNGKKVGVIGAGPSGLTCAYYLARLGYDVDVFDSNPLPGGILNYGIPEYRLPAAVLAREIQEMQKAGFQIHLNTTVGKDIPFGKLQSQTDAIYIAIGTQLPQKAGVEGEELEGVLPGITFLKDVALRRHPVLVGKTIAVIGGGNTAIDSARTALRLGAEKVIILYRRTREAMPANESEIVEALEEGIELQELVSPERFVAGEDGKLVKVECVRREVVNFDKSGRRNTKVIAGSNFFVDVDVAITAVSQQADYPFISTGAISVTPWGTLVVDPNTLMTSSPGVFAGGDVIRGSDVAVAAIADGKKAAAAIDLFLGGKGVLDKGRAIDIPTVIDSDTVEFHNRFEREHLLPEKRCKTFDEVVVGYHKLNAMAESMRCLHCDRR